MQPLELEGQQEAVGEEQYQQLHLQMEALEEILCCKVLEGAARQEQQMAQTVETDGLRFMMGKQQQEVEVVRRRLRGEMVLWADSGLGLREWDELHEALPEVDWDVALGGAP